MNGWNDGWKEGFLGLLTATKKKKKVVLKSHVELSQHQMMTETCNTPKDPPFDPPTPIATRPSP